MAIGSVHSAPAHPNHIGKTVTEFGVTNCESQIHEKNQTADMKFMKLVALVLPPFFSFFFNHTHNYFLSKFA